MGRLKQGDWGGGSLRISDCGEEFHRQVLLDRARALDATVAAHILESWMLAEVATSVAIAAQQRSKSCCPADMMAHIELVYSHLIDWVNGRTVEVPADVGSSLCKITSAGESSWMWVWFVGVLVRKCGHSFGQGGWSCNDIKSYTPEGVLVSKSIVSVLHSAATTMNCLNNQHTGGVVAGLDLLPALLKGGNEAAVEEEDQEQDLEEEEEEQADVDDGAAVSQGTTNNRAGRSLAGKYDEVWEHRKLMLAAVFFPMSHAETQSIMHCPTQAATETSRQDALQHFLDAQVDSLQNSNYEENTVVMAALESMLEDAELHHRHIALDKSRVDRSVSFIEELGCNAVYRALQGCIAGQFRGGSFMTPMADGKHLFETDSNDHGYLYVGMCSLHAAPQAVLAGMVVADDKEPQWAEDGAAVLAGSKAYREDWHNWLEQVFSGGDVPSAAEIGDALANLLDDDSAAAAKRDFRVQTLDDSNDILSIAEAIAAQHTLIQSADTDNLDEFTLPHQTDGHKKAMWQCLGPAQYMQCHKWLISCDQRLASQNTE